VALPAAQRLRSSSMAGVAALAARAVGLRIDCVYCGYMGVCVQRDVVIARGCERSCVSVWASWCCYAWLHIDMAGFLVCVCRVCLSESTEAWPLMQPP